MPMWNSSRKTPQQKQQHEADERLIGMLKTAADLFHQHLFANTSDAKETLRYVREKRGFSDETIQQFQIGYAPQQWQWLHEALSKIGYSEHDLIEGGLMSRNDAGNTYDRFRHRLMIPIRDERGRVRGFGARALKAEDSPKYLNSPQSSLFDKSRTLFGLDRAKRSIQDMGYAVIVEGYMDAIQAHQAGYTNVVAQMGTALTEAQLGLLVPRNTQKIILALDADQAGQNATRRSLEVARQTLKADYAGRLTADIRILHIDDAKDPDDVLRETPRKMGRLRRTRQTRRRISD
ncbi:toprim domain-containing protein [bacterium]|nr:toprim domain-containing protein [bacterium]